MQDKSVIYLCFLNIRQFLCPKNAFSLIYIGIKSIKADKVMTEKMLKFVKVNLQTQKKREVKNSKNRIRMCVGIIYKCPPPEVTLEIPSQVDFLDYTL